LARGFTAARTELPDGLLPKFRAASAPKESIAAASTRLREKYDIYIVSPMGRPRAVKSVRQRRAASTPPSKPVASDGPVTSAYRILDYPLHYFTAIQRQNQTNLAQVLKPLGLAVHEWRVLSALSEKNGQTVTQIAEATVLDRTGLGRLLEQMEANSLVERMTAPDDGRAVLIRLAPGGKRRYAAAWPRVSAHYARLLDGISDKDFKTLMQILRRVKANALMMSNVEEFE
jgi:DNA-binding MarR family transcriptional regulator